MLLKFVMFREMRRTNLTTSLNIKFMLFRQIKLFNFYNSLLYLSDGAGRTGTYIAISNLLERMKTEQVVDVFQAVKIIRGTRPQFVENVVSRFKKKTLKLSVFSSNSLTKIEFGTSDHFKFNRDSSCYDKNKLTKKDSNQILHVLSSLYVCMVNTNNISNVLWKHGVTCFFHKT